MVLKNFLIFFDFYFLCVECNSNFDLSVSLTCHCEERSDAAISLYRYLLNEIATPSARDDNVRDKPQFADLYRLQMTVCSCPHPRFVYIHTMLFTLSGKVVSPLCVKNAQIGSRICGQFVKYYFLVLTKSLACGIIIAYLRT